jgi:hypothetical protein
MRLDSIFNPWILLYLDVVIIALHLIFSPYTDVFHLDVEANVPTVYQSLKLLILGGIGLWWLRHARHQTKRVMPSHTKKMLWGFVLPLSLGLFMIGIDELFQVHEHSYRFFENTSLLHPEQVVAKSLEIGYRSSLWILYYSPLIIAGFAWTAYWLHHFFKQNTKTAKQLGLVLVLVAVVLLAEILSSTGDHSHHLYFYLVTLEEGAEILLATIVAHVLADTIGLRFATPRWALSLQKWYKNGSSFAKHRLFLLGRRLQVKS